MIDDASGGPAGDLIAGRYRIDSLIGRGATATVYRARDESLGREVALKLFEPNLADPAGLARYEAEMRLAATLSHPGLVTLFDAGTDTRVQHHPRMFLCMELIHGRDLNARLRNGALSSEQTAFIGAELAAALDYVHGRGIIHRDIKPANILLPERGNGSSPRAKLTDFGIARIIEGTRVTATNTTIGTAAYLSPEQATGAVLGPESDIYSLGLVFLECLKGTVEFPGTPVESAVARLHRQPHVPAGVGPTWVALLTAMTAANPLERPTAKDVESALRVGHASGAPGKLPGTDGARTRPLPSMPERPPHASPAAARTRILIPAVPAEDDEAAGVSAQPSGLLGRDRHHLWVRPRLPGSVAWIIGIGLVLALLVALVVNVRMPQPPSTKPKPSPSISGPLGEHIDQLRRSVTP